MMILNKKYIPLILTVVAVVLLVIGAFNARLEIGDYGLIHGLPVIYIIGLGVLTIASSLIWFFDESHSRLLFVQLTILIAALWLAPAFAGGSHPSTNHALRSLGLVEYMARTGDIGGRTVPYLSWCGSYIVPVYLNRWFGINFESMINYAPLIMQLLYIVPLYIFLRNVVGKTKYIYIGMWIFFIANWTGNDYLFSTPALGMFFLLILMALITMPSLWERDGKYRKFLVAFGHVYILSVITHFLLSLVSLGILFAVLLVKRSKSIMLALLACIVILGLWSFTGAERYVDYILEDVKILSTVDDTPTEQGYPSYQVGEDEAKEVNVDSTVMRDYIDVPELPIIKRGRAITVDLLVILKGQVLTYISGSDSHKKVAGIRVVYSGLFILMAGIGVIFAIRKKEEHRKALLVLLMGAIPMGLLILPYAGRMVERLYVVALIPVAYFVIRLVMVKAKVVVPIICVFLILCMPVHFIAHYGNQAYDYVSEEHIEGLHYFHKNTRITEAWYYIMGLPFPWLMQDLDKVCVVPINWLRYSDGEISSIKGYSHFDWWLIITRQDRAFYDLICDAPDFVDEVEALLAKMENVTLTYSNRDFSAYKIEMEDTEE